MTYLLQVLPYHWPNALEGRAVAHKHGLGIMTLLTDFSTSPVDSTKWGRSMASIVPRTKNRVPWWSLFAVLTSKLLRTVSYMQTQPKRAVEITSAESRFGSQLNVAMEKCLIQPPFCQTVEQVWNAFCRVPQGIPQKMNSTCPHWKHSLAISVYWLFFPYPNKLSVPPSFSQVGFLGSLPKKLRLVVWYVMLALVRHVVSDNPQVHWAPL